MNAATPQQLLTENNALREQLYYWQQHALHYKARTTSARVQAKAAHPAGKDRRIANSPWAAKAPYGEKP